MLTVYNCGQGDSLRLQFPDCVWSERPLYIDLGPRSYQVSIPEPAIDLLITHSDWDHVGGRIIGSHPSIIDLYIPAYLPEYRKILKKIDPTLLHPIPRNMGLTKFLWDGVKIGRCDHSKVLNPPLQTNEIFDVDVLPGDEIDSYLEQFSTNVEEILSDEEDFPFPQRPEGYDARGFVLRALSQIILYDRDEKNSGLVKFHEYDANRISVVFSYKYREEFSLLLTGDADKYVFNRLIRRGEPRLKATVLKVPHHGSSSSLDLNILKYIQPKVAVTSHNCGHFSSSPDRHPNESIVLLLRSLGVSDFYTNPFSKPSGIYGVSTVGPILGWPVEIK